MNGVKSHYQPIIITLFLSRVDIIRFGDKPKPVIKQIITCNKLIKVCNSITHDMWPLLTTTKCWHCTYSFNHMPVGIPDNFHSNKYYVYGNFCSCQCALAFLLYSDDIRMDGSKYSKPNVIQLLHMMYNDLYTNFESVGKLTPAPPKQILVDYGGNKTIDQFREGFTQNIKYEAFKPPFEPLTLLLVER